MFLSAYMPLDQISATFLVVEFVNIIVTLHTSKPSKLPLPGSLLHLSIQIRIIIAFFLYDLVSLFYGCDAHNKGGQ